MKNIFWGFFFLFVNFNLTVNGHILNLLPPFVGCWLLYRGFEELRAESERFYALRPFTVGLGIYTALIWIGDLLGVSTGSWISVLVGIILFLVAVWRSRKLYEALPPLQEEL